MTKLYETVGAANYDDIIAMTEPSTLVTTVTLAQSDKPLARGTVLVASEAGGTFAPASEALKATDVLVVLAESIESAEANEVVQAYKAGNFVRGRLTGNGTYTLAAADFEALRKSGIQTTGMVEEDA